LVLIDNVDESMDRNEITTRIANKIRKKRIELQLSQEKLGEICDIHRTYIGAIERGEKQITVVTLNKIARALNLQIEYFLRK